MHLMLQPRCPLADHNNANMQHTYVSRFVTEMIVVSLDVTPATWAALAVAALCRKATLLQSSCRAWTGTTSTPTIPGLMQNLSQQVAPPLKVITIEFAI
jgi:hypothetical protein